MAYGPYADHQYGKLMTKQREYRLTGRPEWARDLQVQIDAEIPYGEIVLPDEEGAADAAKFFPETTVAAHLVELPTRMGRGSSRVAWVQFARLVSEVESEVIEALTRDGIIQLMEDRGIILPSEESSPLEGDGILPAVTVDTSVVPEEPS
jgi:hypothetical protein